MAASSGPVAGSAASGSIGSISLSEGLSTLADQVTLALLALSGVSETLTVAAIRASAGTPVSFFKVDLLHLGRFCADSGMLLRRTSSSLSISLLFARFLVIFVKKY
jgi:hypothetical protein